MDYFSTNYVAKLCQLTLRLMWSSAKTARKKESFLLSFFFAGGLKLNV